MVAEVEPGAPAALAGVQPGDVIVSINGAAVRSWQQCTNQIGLTRVGDQLTLAIDRQGQRVTIPVKVAPRPAQRRTGRRQFPTPDDEAGPDQP